MPAITATANVTFNPSPAPTFDWTPVNQTLNNGSASLKFSVDADGKISFKELVNVTGINLVIQVGSAVKTTYIVSAVGFNTSSPIPLYPPNGTPPIASGSAVGAGFVLNTNLGSVSYEVTYPDPAARSTYYYAFSISGGGNTYTCDPQLTDSGQG
jgi:hypothetical protein